MKKSMRISAAIGLAVVLTLSAAVHAEDADQGMASAAPAGVSAPATADLNNQITALRAAVVALSAQQDDMGKTLKNWVNLSGDLRYRYENNDFFNTPAAKIGVNTVQAGLVGKILDWERYRLRLRIQELAQVNDFTNVVVRLSTDTYLTTNAPYGWPNATTQVLNSYGDKAPVFVEDAYMVIAPRVILQPTFVAGVQGMPFLFDGTNANLIFDDGLTDDGLSLSLMTPTWMGADLRVIAAQFINEDSDTGLAFYSPTQHPKFEGSQVVLDFNAAPMGAAMGLSLGAAYYNWLYVKGTDIFTQGWPGTYTNNVGNTGTNILTNGFSLDDFIATYNAVLAGVPIKAFYEHVQNTVEVGNNVGYVTGAEVASGNLIPWNKNEVTLGYNYRVVDTDAVLSIWSDINFNGGGTDAMGGKFYAIVMLGKALWVSFQELNDQGNLQAEATGGHYSLCQRTLVDINAKF